LSAWRPLSQRVEQATEEALCEGVPSHLQGPLQEWIVDRLNDVMVATIALRLRLDLRAAKIHPANPDRLSLDPPKPTYEMMR
jgi:hypothetical protein